MDRKLGISNGVKFADLHTHTIFSDGMDTPQELINKARGSGLSALAICDHDTVDGIFVANSFCQNTGIEIIPSLELSAEYNNSEVHILGFFIDCLNPHLLSELKQIRSDRRLRMQEMVDKLNNLGVKISIEKVFNIAGDATVGRAHLARVLYSERYVSTIQEAFYKYIGENCPAYVSRFKLKPKEAIELVLASGGVPALAHPYSLNNDGLIEEFAGYGLAALEVYYPEHSPSMIMRYESIADKFKLIKTGGSDYHGMFKPQTTLGKVKVPYSVVEELKNACPVRDRPS